MSAQRILQTAVYLRPIQVVDRALRWLRWRWAAHVSAVVPGRLLGEAAVLPVPLSVERPSGQWISIFDVEREMVGDLRWAQPGVSRLWAYRLHCFRWIHELPKAEARGWIEDWIDRNPPGTRPGWEPYCLSLRIREWLEWLVGSRNTTGRDRTLASLARQVDALGRQVEYHLLGNHLLENAVTLCWAGLRLSGPQRHVWLRQGMALLEYSLREQILADGAHAERSPMYHATVAEGLLRLASVAADVTGRAAEKVAAMAGDAGRRLAGSLSAFVHPDGEYALVNDTALGAAPTFRELVARFALAGSGTLADGITALPDAGFVGWRGGEDAYLLFDAGPIGPNHQPGHGHAGALGFEWSHRGERLVTDTGVFTYERDEVRSWDRSTAAHSTVEVDGRNQSDVWAAFRCGRRIRVLPVRWREVEGGAILRGSYVGPATGVSPACHVRTLRVGPWGCQVSDRITCRGRHDAVTRLHLAPGVEAHRDGDAIALHREGQVTARLVGDSSWEISRSPYHPTFGREVERACLELRVSFRNRLSQNWMIEVY